MEIDLSASKWYVAELVMEITVSGDLTTVVHRNLVLIQASESEQAYEKATQVGFRAETNYKNPDGMSVQMRFVGISKLDALYEDIEDGAELTFEEVIGLSVDEVCRLVPPKEQLGAFAAPRPGRQHSPDYRSKEVMELAIDRAANRNR